MYDDLARIERSYGCYAEYARCQEEQEQREYEHYLEECERYKRNREKLKAAKVVLYFGGCSNCNHCTHADHNTQRDSDDDFDIVICNAPDGYACERREYELLPDKYNVIAKSPDGSDDRIFPFKLLSEAEAYVEENHGIFHMEAFFPDEEDINYPLVIEEI